MEVKMNWLIKRWFQKNFIRCKECACVVQRDNKVMHKENAHGIKAPFNLMDDFGPNGREWK